MLSSIVFIMYSAYSINCFNFSRNAVYSRYSTQDWGHSNSMNFSLSEKERSFAERLRADAWRAVKETDARTRNRQNDITKKLGTYNIIMFRVVLYANKCKHILKTGQYR